MSASFTATIGYCSTPSLAMARRRITPVVVSSVPPSTPQQILALGVQQRHQIRAIIHRDLRLVFGRGQQVRVVDVVVLALDRVDGDAVVAHQGGGHVVLRGKRIGGAEHDRSAAVAQRDHQVGGLGGHVQARGHLDARQRLRLDELLADGLQHGHGLESPLRAPLAHVGQAKIFYVTCNLVFVCRLPLCSSLASVAVRMCVEFYSCAGARRTAASAIIAASRSAPALSVCFPAEAFFIAAKMTESGGVSVDRPPQFQVFDNAARL